jgi:hypothetical protein
MSIADSLRVAVRSQESSQVPIRNPNDAVDTVDDQGATFDPAMNRALANLKPFCDFGDCAEPHWIATLKITAETSASMIIH